MGRYNNVLFVIKVRHVHHLCYVLYTTVQC